MCSSTYVLLNSKIKERITVNMSLISYLRFVWDRYR
jgi:hypothetical protein